MQHGQEAEMTAAHALRLLVVAHLLRCGENGQLDAVPDEEIDFEPLSLPLNDSQLGWIFIFGAIGLHHVGTYRLRFDLYSASDRSTILSSVTSETIRSVPAEQWPDDPQWATPLSQRLQREHSEVNIYLPAVP